MEPRNAFVPGFLLGGGFAIFAVVAEAMWVLANRAASSPQSTPAQIVWLAVFITILGAGLVVGGVAAVRTRSRRFGLGIVVGLVVGFPVLWLLTAFLMWGGQ